MFLLNYYDVIEDIVNLDFTIQNVPIKSIHHNYLPLFQLPLQYKMFLLNNEYTDPSEKATGFTIQNVPIK